MIWSSAGAIANSLIEGRMILKLFKNLIKRVGGSVSSMANQSLRLELDIMTKILLL
jgi:hypothetical protein